MTIGPVQFSGPGMFCDEKEFYGHEVSVNFEGVAGFAMTSLSRLIGIRMDLIRLIADYWPNIVLGSLVSCVTAKCTSSFHAHEVTVAS